MKDDVGCLFVLYKPNFDQIAKVKKSIEYFSKVVIVDNSPNSNESFFSIKNNFVYFNFPSNLGLAAGLNFGFKQFDLNHFKFCVYFDQDTDIPDDINEKYIDVITKYEKKDVAVFSPLYIIDRKKVPLLEKRYSFTKLIMTSASVFNLEIMHKINFFDERYFLDCVDYEYSLKSVKNGYCNLIYHGYAIKHNPGITKKKFNIRYGYMTPDRFYYQIRNLKLLFKDYHYFKLKIILLIKYLKVFIFFEKKVEYFSEWKAAIFDYKNNIFYKKNF